MGIAMYNKLIGCWVSAEMSFCTYNFLSEGKGFYSFGDAKKDFIYTYTSESVTIHYVGDFMPSTFKYSICENILSIEDSFGNLVRYNRKSKGVY